MRDDHAPPAPFHVTPRGFAGPNLLAMTLFEKFGQHQPLNRRSERYRREGIDLNVSTRADQVVVDEWLHCPIMPRDCASTQFRDFP
jgi:transposase